MYRLLIADDERIEMMALHRTLERRLGDLCQIFEADNGREAVKVYEREQIQIAILDIEMPGINGIQAAEWIRKRDKNCCIIFLTAFDEFSYARKAIAVRALDYLLKPYDEEELISVVVEAMRLVSEGEEQSRRAELIGGAEPADKVWQGEPLEGELGDASPEPESASSEPESNMRLSMVAEAIEAYMRQNFREDISMQDAARAMNYSEAYFCKLFKQCFGKNFTARLAEYRVEEAKKLLVGPIVNIREIGRSVGYEDSNYFAKVFKRITGQSPTEYRVSAYKENQQLSD